MRSSAGTSRSARGSASSARMAIASRDFRELRLDGDRPRLRPGARAARRDADRPAGRVRRPARPVRLRQVHRAELHRRAAAADRRRRSGWTSSASTRLRPEERGFGMVFQNYALFPHMTVRRNIGFGLRHAAPPAGRDRPAGRRGAGAGAAGGARPTSCPASSPAASSSAWRSRAPSSSSRRWC